MEFQAQQIGNVIKIHGEKPFNNEGHHATNIYEEEFHKDDAAQVLQTRIEKRKKRRLPVSGINFGTAAVGALLAWSGENLPQGPLLIHHPASAIIGGAIIGLSLMTETIAMIDFQGRIHQDKKMLDAIHHLGQEALLERN